MVWKGDVQRFAFSVKRSAFYVLRFDTQSTMKNKQIKSFLLLILASLLLFVMAACDSDDSDERSKFLGRYEVEEQSLETYTPRDDYEVNILKDTGSQSLVIISNFYNYDVDVYARIDGYNIYVENELHGIFEFNGSGSLSGSVITIDYNVEAVADDVEYFDRLRAEMVRKD